MEIILPVEFSGDGKYVDANIGIYAIVNPDGEIYIGQSSDLPERIRQHKKNGGKKTKYLKLSMFRHGRNNHRYYLVEKMQDASHAMLCEKEKYYIKKYTDDGFILLNAYPGGNGAPKGHSFNKGSSVFNAVKYGQYKQPL